MAIYFFTKYSFLALESTILLASNCVCFFARKVYTPDRIISALNAIGIEGWTVERLEDLGRVIHRAKMDFKFREGFSLAKLRIPRRIFEVPTPHGFLKEEEMRKAIEIYGRIIGREV